MPKKSLKIAVNFFIFIILIIIAFFINQGRVSFYIIPAIFIFIFLFALIWQGKKIFSMFSGIKKISQSGMVFSPKVWTWEEGESLSFSDIFSGINIVSKNFNPASLPKIKPNKVAEGEKEGVNYKIYRLNFSLPAAPAFLQARLTFPKIFPGRLILHRVDGPTLGQDVNLESIEFNKKTYAYTNQPKVAYQIISPDLMDWYLKLSDRPIIVFENNFCFYTRVENLPSRQTEILPVIEELIERVKRSGALVWFAFIFRFKIQDF